MELTGSIDTLYSVSLQDYPGLPAQERMQAELRFCRTAERLLGGPENVARAYGAWCAAAESDGMEVSEDDRPWAQRWVKALDQARNDGMRSLGESEGAYFEVRLG